MSDATLLERIEINPAVLLGKPVVRGTRLSVEWILGLLADGWGFDDLLIEYPGLSDADIRACIAYAKQRIEDEKIYAGPRAVPG
jgi:uncharacterized protein (DUF433 family)